MTKRDTIPKLELGAKVGLFLGLGLIRVWLMLGCADAIAAECALDISLPVADGRDDLPFIAVKGLVTPATKLVGNIRWQTTIGGTEYETETGHDAEGNIIVSPPFPAHNSATASLYGCVLKFYWKYNRYIIARVPALYHPHSQADLV